jgi:hypothetical protein
MMKLFNFFLSFILVFISYSRNINNIIQITHSGKDYNLANIDPLSSGEMVYSNLSFGTSADVQEVLAIFEEVNYLDASGQLNLNKQLSLIKTAGGSVKLVKGFVYIAKFGENSVSLINGFNDNLQSLLNTHLLNGQTVSISEFKNLIYKSTLPVPEEGLVALTQAEMDFVNTIRNSIPMPNSNTIMQKVMPVSYKDAFFISDGNPKTIGGYMTTAKDAKHLDSYPEIFDGMRLDYKGSDFVDNNATECLVIRFKSKDIGKLNIPRNKNNGGVLNDPAVTDPFNKNSYPFTGNGFTSGKNGTLGVPEWKADFGNNLEILNGAEMYIIKSDGTEILIGIYNENLTKFVIVN